MQRFRRGTMIGTSACFIMGSMTHAQPMPAVRVVVAEARLVEVSPTITLVGTVAPARMSLVRSEVSGVVVEVPVRQGDRVSAGQLLYRLDDRRIRASIDQAKSRLGVLQARHQELLAGTRKEQISELKAKLDEATAEVQRWTLEGERIAKLYAGSESHAKEVYDTKASLAGAEARRAGAQAMHELGVAGPRAEVIAAAAHEVAEQQALICGWEIELDKHVIRAPFAGYIVRQSIEIGSKESEMSGMMPGNSSSLGASVVIMELDPVLVRVDVPEAAFPFAKVSEPVHVKVDALDRAFAGRIRHVVPLADTTARTFPVEIEVANPSGEIAAGMFVRVPFPSGPRTQQVTVPKDAIVVGKGTDQVAMVITGPEGKPAAILVSVTVGGSVDDCMAITSGNIPPGAKIVTKGNERIMPFPTPIEIVDEQGTPVADAVLKSLNSPEAVEKKTAEGAALGGS